ncbi:MAG: hypothetical protein Q9169_007692 [Polycauliona sp. 2 TL-2023]
MDEISKTLLQQFHTFSDQVETLLETFHQRQEARETGLVYQPLFDGIPSLDDMAPTQLLSLETLQHFRDIHTTASTIVADFNTDENLAKEIDSLLGDQLLLLDLMRSKCPMLSGSSLDIVAADIHRTRKKIENYLEKLVLGQESCQMLLEDLAIFDEELLGILERLNVYQMDPETSWGGSTTA